MTHIGWLHLTDLHIGSRLGRRFEDDAFGELIDDLAFMSARSGPWQFVFLTGDLAQTGAAGDYEAASRHLERLFDKIGECNGGERPLLLAVPGNHDLRRFEPDYAVVKELRGHRGRELFHGDKAPFDNSYAQAVFLRFDAFKSWYAAWRASHLPVGKQAGDWKDGLAPGDFRYDGKVGNVTISVVGLNTSLFHLGDEFGQGSLHIYPAQFAALVPNAREWERAFDFRVLLTHHPASWLHPDSDDEFRGLIAPAGRFSLHLFGHMHQPDAQRLGRVGAPDQVELQGASLLGLDTYEQDKKRLHGYAAAKAYLDDGDLAHAIWPRRMWRTLDRRWRMIADPEYVLDKEHQGFVLSRRHRSSSPRDALTQLADLVEDAQRSTRTELFEARGDMGLQRVGDALEFSLALYPRVLANIIGSGRVRVDAVEAIGRSQVRYYDLAGGHDQSLLSRLFRGHHWFLWTDLRAPG